MMKDKQYTAAMPEKYFTRILFSFPNITDAVLAPDIFIIK